MPPYVPVADDVTIPVLGTLAGTAQADFIALKRKINNVFYESGHYQPLFQQRINSGLVYEGDLPAGTNPGIMYGFAAHVTRNDDTPATSPLGNGVASVGLQTSSLAGNNVNNPGLYVFGAALEAWTSQINSQALLIGLESSIIAQYNNNIAGLVGFDIVFKNRPDGYTGGIILATAVGPDQKDVPYVIKSIGTTDFTAMGASANTVGLLFRHNGTVGAGTGTLQASTAQGKGANKFNPLSRAMQITSQVSSGSGELVGWHRGITFESNSISAAIMNVGGVDVVVPGIVISMTNMGEPLNSSGPNNPWIAYPHSSALALSEYMSITWDKDQNVRSFLDSYQHILWFAATDGSQATEPFRAFGFDYTGNMMVFNATPGGAPGAATASVKIRLGNGVTGANYYIALTPAP